MHDKYIRLQCLSSIWSYFDNKQNDNARKYLQIHRNFIQHDINEDGYSSSVLGDFRLWWCLKRHGTFFERTWSWKLDTDICLRRNWSERCEQINGSESYGPWCTNNGCQVETSICCDSLGLTTGDLFVSSQKLSGQILLCILSHQISWWVLSHILHFVHLCKPKGWWSRSPWGCKQRCKGSGDFSVLVFVHF